MARPDAIKLGEYISKFLAKAISEAELRKLALALESMPKRELRALIHNRFVRVGVKARILGYTLQTEVLQESAQITAAALRLWQEQAFNQAEIIAKAADAIRGNLDSPNSYRIWIDEANTIAARKGFDNGMKSSADEFEAFFKTWVRTAPVKEPRPHSALEGKTIPVGQKFILPSGSANEGAAVQGPRDDVPEWAAEWRYCGHSLVYSKAATLEDLR